MTVLFGHPAGNPNSHQAALAHLEAGWLEAFCVPWMPSLEALRVFRSVPRLRGLVDRLARRNYAPLDAVEKVQDRGGEFRRLALRALGFGDEALSYEANDWLMSRMTVECERPAVTAVHAYEDCSLDQFRRARSLGKACIYDMPIGYYPAWQDTQQRLVRHYVDWLPPGGLAASRVARPEQKREEMALADLVLAPSSFVERTIRSFHSDIPVARAHYGVDLSFWSPTEEPSAPGPLRFVFAGQLSLRKGVPDLLLAWERAALQDAELLLVGSWQLSEDRLAKLPPNVQWRPPCGPAALREYYRSADVFVFPSHFEGFGLVLLEAMACGLPVIASDASAAPDVLVGDCGHIVPAGDIDELAGQLIAFSERRDDLAKMGRAARACAERCSWSSYREQVKAAVRPFV